MEPAASVQLISAVRIWQVAMAFAPPSALRVTLAYSGSHGGRQIMHSVRILTEPHARRTRGRSSSTLWTISKFRLHRGILVNTYNLILRNQFKQRACAICFLDGPLVGGAPPLAPDVRGSGTSEYQHATRRCRSGPGRRSCTHWGMSAA